ncbi:MAG: dihydrolipoamide acetyltransferase family protein [Capnocytophaga sp.]|nr:dihydrolipoamide acetyltransferase family protein [Capnocytophaga sp.]
MARYELRLPSMGESVAEATITAWFKKVGDTIETDESIVEVATDKVDSEIPSEIDGVLTEILFQVEDVVKIGEVIAIIETNEPTTTAEPEQAIATDLPGLELIHSDQTEEAPAEDTIDDGFPPELAKFYSPLVRSIAKKEGVTLHELNKILGTGAENRVTKEDILMYIDARGPIETKPTETPKKEEIKAEEKLPVIEKAPQPIAETKSSTPAETPKITEKETPIFVVEKPQTAAAESVKKVIADDIVPEKQPVSVTQQGDEVIEMSRMGKLIAQHMTMSKQTSAHVQSFTEVDVTRIWNWRNKVKKAFEARENEKFTFTPIFMEAVVKALQDFPMMNISVEGTTIIKKKDINIGMATALPDGNLIVPVIKHADQLNLRGMTKVVNDLANRARTNQLKPDDIKDGTYTVTNIGSFGNVFGTPIINQPQVGILAIGAIRKVPAVIETPEGDVIGIRYKMMLSHSYDHRVVNGALGGMFVQRVGEYLENWDTDREI